MSRLAGSTSYPAWARSDISNTRLRPGLSTRAAALCQAVSSAMCFVFVCTITISSGRAIRYR